MTVLAPPTTTDAVLLRRAADRRADDADALRSDGQTAAAELADHDAYTLYRWAHWAAKTGGRCSWQAIVTHARAVLGG